MTRDPTHYVLVLGVGIVAALFYVVLSFVPVGFVFEGALLVGLGVWLGRRRPRLWRPTGVLLVVPTLVFLAYVFRNLGWLPRADGIGINHHLAFVLFPLATVFGAWWGKRKSEPPPQVASANCVA